MATENFVGAGHIFRAPLGTAFPAFTGDYANYAQTLTSAGFADVATVYSDGLGFTPSREYNEPKDWNGNVIRRLSSSHSEELTFTLVNWMSDEVQKAAFGDDNVTEVANGHKTAFNDKNIPDSAWVILMIDGDNITEMQVERGAVSVNGTIGFMSSDITKLPLKVNAIKGEGDDTVVIYTTQKPAA